MIAGVIGDEQRHLVIVRQLNHPARDQLGLLGAAATERPAFSFIDRRSIFCKFDAQCFIIIPLCINTSVDAEQLGEAAGVLEAKGGGRSQHHTGGIGGIEDSSEPSGLVGALGGHGDRPSGHPAGLAVEGRRGARRPLWARHLNLDQVNSHGVEYPSLSYRMPST